MDSFDDYQLATLRTWRYDAHSDDSLSNAAFGIGGESGEFLEMVKKHFHHGIPIDHEKARKELGDLLYYVARAADVFHFNLSEVAAANIAKLKARYPEGFVEGGGKRD